MKTIDEIVKELHQLNFGDDGIVKVKDFKEDYNYINYKENNFEHPLAGYCKRCENCQLLCKNCDISKEIKEKVKFTYVSHGSHTYDFLNSRKVNASEDIDVSEWFEKPILFVMENPSTQKYYDSSPLYYRKDELSNKINESDLKYPKYEKYPAQKWYWIHKDKSNTEYPVHFYQRAYGELVSSIINTFKMKNAYLTNMVKCGLGYWTKDKTKISEHYVSTSYYNQDIINNCLKILKKEADILRQEQQIIIFAFKKNVFNTLNEFFENFDVDKNIYKIYSLPHPVDYGFSDDFRKYILFSKIVSALIHNGYYNEIPYKDILECLTQAIE